METWYTVLRPDGRQERKSVDWPAEPSIWQIHALIDPILGTTMMEHVYILGDKDKPQDMFVDEVGHWNERNPRNEEATRLYRRNTMKRYPGIDPENIPYIVGTAVVFDRVVWT